MVTNSNIEKRVDAFLAQFSREGEEIRNRLASTLPAYNQLLNLRALTFEEFALMKVGEEQGLSYKDDYFSVLPPCPMCGAKDRIRRQKAGFYFCPACNKRYKAHYKSIASDTHCSSVVWLKVLHSLLNFMGQTAACKYCEISPNTYIKIRNKLFYAMSLLMDRVKLYGSIEADITFVRLSYRGMSLDDTVYPEGSLFDEISVVPRSARKRGGSYSYTEKDKNSVAIFTAVDDRGHALARFTGLGKVTAHRLLQNVPKEKFLSAVPDKDPFPFMKERTAAPKTVPGAETLLCSDGESAIEKYTEESHIAHRKNTYTKGGKTLHVLRSGEHIQHINSLHSRLKRFLSKCNYISTRYLPGYLTLFEFIENCGISDESIRQIFMILAEPNLGRPLAFYEEMFAVPNVFVQWLDTKNPLRHFQYRQIVAYKMYADRVAQIERGEKNPILVKEIQEVTGYSEQSIRRIYKNLKASGYDEIICQDIGETKERKRPSTTQRRFESPVVLAFHDAFVVNANLPPAQQKKKSALLIELNEKYKTNFSMGTLCRYFKQIEEKGLRESFSSEADWNKLNFSHNEYTAMKIHTAFVELQKQYRKSEFAIPSARELAESVGREFDLTAEKVLQFLRDYDAGRKKRESRLKLIEG